MDRENWVIFVSAFVLLMAVGKIKCHELRTKTKSELLTQVEGLKKELAEVLSWRS